jgi:HAD superfamily hydrolase (TIGR01549 family)
MYRTILFDMDGTLSPSLPQWLKAFHQAFDQFGQQHSDELVIKSCFYRDPKHFVGEFGIDHDEFVDHLNAALKVNMEERSLFDGVVEMLDLCKSQQIVLGLVTSAKRETVQQVLIPLGIYDRFATIVAGGEASHYKPHPAPVLMAMQHLSACRETTIFIGDASADIEAGKAAGVDTALFRPEANAQFHDHEALAAAKPHFVFDDYAVMRGYLTAGWPAKLEHPYAL